MTTETLWITLPTNEENELKNIISSISSKNLTNLSIKQLIKKLENNQAADWIEVLDQYNAISSVKNINTSEMLNRAESVRDKFGEGGFPKLKDRQFEPRELLSLVILCYSNPTLIGPNLCQALRDNNQTNIKKEMLENSARVGDRIVAPWASNLRLLSTALYFNDTAIRLPKTVIDKVVQETKQKKLYVLKLDQRNGFSEPIDGPTRVRNEGTQGVVARRKRGESEIDSYAILQSLQSMEHDTEEDHSLPQLDFSVTASQISHSDNGTELTSEVLPLNATNNAVNSSYASGLIVGGLVGFHALKNLPVISPVLRNMGKDLVTASKYVGSFFSRNVESEEQQDKKKQRYYP